MRVAAIVQICHSPYTHQVKGRHGNHREHFNRSESARWVQWYHHELM